MGDTDIHWSHGRTVRFSIADDVLDPADVLSAASYALLFARDDRPLAQMLQGELGSLGVAVEVSDDATAAPVPRRILVQINPAPRRSASRLERPRTRHDR